MSKRLFKKGTSKSKELFKISATSKQIAFLTKLLPKGYRFENLKNAKQPNKYQGKIELKKISNSDQIETCQELPKTRSLRKKQKKQEKSSNLGSQPSQSLEFISSNFSQMLDYSTCMSILTELKRHHSAWPFLEPVDAEELGVPEYYQIIKQPMDLQTIQTKLTTGKYLHDSQMHSDIRRILKNSYQFNEGDPQYTKVTKSFQKFYDTVLRKYEKQKQRQIRSKYPQIESPEKGLTLMEKQILAKQLKALSSKQREGLIKIVYGPCFKGTILDINNLDIKTQRRIKKLADKMIPIAIQDQCPSQEEQSSFNTQSSSDNEQS